MQTTWPPPASEPLSYAVPIRRESKVWAGLAVAFVGLVLMLFGGCFFVGILIQLAPQVAFGPTSSAPAWTARMYVAHVTLYVLGIAFIGSGAYLVVQGAKGLLRIALDART